MWWVYQTLKEIQQLLLLTTIFGGVILEKLNNREAVPFAHIKK